MESSEIAILSAVVAGIAALAAVFSALFARSASKHAKRQADAAMGEVEPIWSAFRQPVREFGSILSLVVECANANRRKVFVERIQVTAGEDFTIFRPGENAGIAIDKMLAQREGREFSYVFNPPEIVAARESADKPTMHSWPFRIAPLRERDGGPYVATVECEAVFRLDGEELPQSWQGSFTVNYEPLR